MWRVSTDERWGWSARAGDMRAFSALGWSMKTAVLAAFIVVLPLILLTVLIAAAVVVIVFVPLVLLMTVVLSLTKNSTGGAARNARSEEDGRQNVRVVVRDTQQEDV